MPGFNCTKNQDSVSFGPPPPFSPSEIRGASASRGNGGNWFMRAITSISIRPMSVPTANWRLMKAPPAFAKGLDLLQPGEAAQRPFLRLDQLGFDFGGRCGAPAREDRDDRLFDVGEELHRQLDEAHDAEHDDEADADGDADRALQ